MPTIKGLKLPDYIVSHLQALIDGVSFKEAVAIAYYIGALKGFRVIPKNLPQIKQKIKKYIEFASELNAKICGFLRDFDTTFLFISQINEASISRNFKDKITYLGKADFLTAILLDERESVFNLGKEYIEKQTESETPDKDARINSAKKIKMEYLPLLSFFKNLLDFLQPEENSDEDENDEEFEKYNEEIKKKIKSLEKKNAGLAKELKKANEYKEKLKEKLEIQKKDFNADKSNLEDEIRKAKKEINELRIGLRKVEETKKELQQSFEERVKSSVNAELHSIKMKWLKKPYELNSFVEKIQKQDGEFQSLLERSESILSLQEKHDKHYGNRVFLEKRLKEMEKTLDRIRKARLESINPLPELYEIAEEITEKIEDLRIKLDIPPVENPFVSALEQRINDASADDILLFREQIMDASEIGGITKKEERRLYGRCNDRMQKIYAQYPGKYAFEKLPNYTLFRLRHAVENKNLYLICLDGYNILFLLKELFEKYYENGKPDIKARERLLQIMAQIVEASPMINIRIYYDSPKPSNEKYGENITIIYSGGGQSEHRADDAIVKDLNSTVFKSNYSGICVVTDDRQLRIRSRKNGAGHMSVEELAIFLDDFDQGILSDT